jgi:hypothetical protein
MEPSLRGQILASLSNDNHAVDNNVGKQAVLSIHLMRFSTAGGEKKENKPK